MIRYLNNAFKSQPATSKVGFFAFDITVFLSSICLHFVHAM
ncbi:hypothetical protein VC87395_000426 [Vibrio paracholerae 87395]|nr:hypothetical protein VC87395_000426 [Vibrio paracholerae 87395]